MNVMHVVKWLYVAVIAMILVTTGNNILTAYMDIGQASPGIVQAALAIGVMVAGFIVAWIGFGLDRFAENINLQYNNSFAAWWSANCRCRCIFTSCES